MLFTLRPLVLETQGLVAALQQWSKRCARPTIGRRACKASRKSKNSSIRNAQGVLFYIVEEAVNNARKHAQAEQICGAALPARIDVVVEIEDNGVGFDVGAVDASYDQRGSLGMINMRERAELIEGTLRIHSAKGRGTKITILIPIHAAGELGDGQG